MSTTIYRTGHNLPGCLPDSDESTYASLRWEDARDVLKDELDRVAEEAAERAEHIRDDDPDGALEADDLRQAAEQAIEELEERDGEDFQVYLEGRSYWLEGSDPIDDEEARRAALAELEGCDLADVETCRWGDGQAFEIGSSEFLVLTDDEADERTEEYIRESVWAFRPEFLQAYMPEGVDAEVLTILQERCESANDALLGMVGDRFDDLVSDAVGCDGRGHFLNHYDGEEREQGEFYIYQTN